MKTLAAYVMKGRTQAAFVILGFAALSFVLPPFSLLSAAALALVTLRIGTPQGLWLMVAGTLLIGITTYVSLGSVVPALAFTLLLWAPVWALAWILRDSQSLTSTLWLAALLGMAGVLVMHLVIADPALWWQGLLQELFEPFIAQSELSAEQQVQLEAMLISAAERMTGLLAAGMVINALFCLFVARSWQAQLYNPGGFRQEFHELRLGVRPALVVVAMGAASFLPLGGISGLAADALMVMLSLFLLQGLAIVHAVVSRRGMHVAWLAGLYVLLFFAMAQMALLLALIGFTDNWIDIRKRLAAEPAA